MSKRTHREMEQSYTSSVLAPSPLCSPEEYLRILHSQRDALKNVRGKIPWPDSDADSQTSVSKRTQALTQKVQSLLATRQKSGGKDEGLAISMVPRLLSLTCTKGGKKWLPRVYHPSTFEVDKPAEQEVELDAAQTQPEPVDADKLDLVAKVVNWVKAVEPHDPEEEKASKKKKKRASDKGKGKAAYSLKDPSPLGFVVSKRRIDLSGKGDGQSDKDSNPRSRKRPRLDNDEGEDGLGRVLVPASSPPPPAVESSPAAHPPESPALESGNRITTTSPFTPFQQGNRQTIDSVAETSFFPPSFPSWLNTSTPPPPTNGRGKQRPEPIPDIPAEETLTDASIVHREYPLSSSPPKKRRESSMDIDIPPVPSSSKSPLKFVPLTSRLPSRNLYLDVDIASPTKSLSSIAADDSSSEDEDEVRQEMFASTQMRKYDSQQEGNLEGDVDDMVGFLEKDVDVGMDEDSQERVGRDKVRHRHHDEEEEDDEEGKDEITEFDEWVNIPRSVSAAHSH